MGLNLCQKDASCFQGGFSPFTTVTKTTPDCSERPENQ